MLGQRGLYVAQIHLQALGFDDECFELAFEELRSLSCGGCGQLSHHGAASGMHLKKSIGDQLRHDLVSRVGIDLQFLAESADGRKAVARAHLAHNDRLLGRVHDLLIDRYSGLEVQPDSYHACTISRHTHKGKNGQWSVPVSRSKAKWAVQNRYIDHEVTYTEQR